MASTTMRTARGAKIGIISPMLPRLSATLLRLALLSVLALPLALGACSALAPKFTKPNVSVTSIEMRGGNLLTQNFAVKLNIQNPNDRALPVRGLSVQMSVGGEQIATGVSDHAVIVPPFGAADFDMTITANMALALLKLNDRLNQHAGSIDYELAGSASLDLPFLRNLPFRQTGSFALN
jgi:LEA14-like dessication related protein